ncbi:FAD-dependent monooxygenase [Brevundimonas sp.]|uniref:FAD-dependent monooxygenase n=1 Tax=Brevundimonas sp. TaxID=1871086 RepID=UPI003D09B1AF
MRIQIIGAGLGGLVAALALRDAGHDVEVHEAAPSLGEVGAGLTLSRGAQHVFRALGIQDRVARSACRSSAFPFLHYKTGRLLNGAHDHGDGGPDDGIDDVARQIHRADLHSVLVEAFAERGPPVVTGHRLTGFDQDDNGVTARFADGSIAQGDALIGADGVKSVVRAQLWGDGEPRFTGQIAYRFLVPAEIARPHMGFGRGAVFLGPGLTFNRYTLRGGQIVNGVGIVRTETWTGEGWSTPASREEILKAFEGWHPDVPGLIGQAEHAIKWGIFDRAPLPGWTQGRVTLLGDAAHAMLPFLGMGAAMAIEDAMILARSFAAEPDVASAFARYEAARLPRTTLVHHKSVEQGLLTQARDPDTYDGKSAPSSDPSLTAYDPVTAPI